jgi:hypothetical protein
MRALKRPNSDTDKDIVFLKTNCHGQKFCSAEKITTVLVNKVKPRLYSDKASLAGGQATKG